MPARHSRPKIVSSLAVAVLLTAAAASCGGDDDAQPQGSAATASEPATSAATAPTVAPPTTDSTTTTTSADPATVPVVSEAPSPLWVDVTDAAIGQTAGWSNKVDLADVDGDGDVDILVADGGDYESPGDPVVSQVWLNDGVASFTDASQATLGDTGSLTRVIKARDLNSDGLVDIFLGTTYQTQSRLFLGRGGSTFEEVTATHLPALDASVGDVDIGDVDGDGDLDLVLADWGPGSPMSNDGAPPRLWLNDGTGVYADASSGRIPPSPVRFSWEIEFVDVDNDFDLDIVESCKQCATSALYHNDGTGSYGLSPQGMPQFTNNYEFEPIDLDGDDFLDLVTINDGPSAAEHVLRGDRGGGFVDATPELWPSDANPGYDDNVVTILDHDSDGDADFLIGSLDGPDRLLVNDGSGQLTLTTAILDGDPTGGTLGLAVADLNADGRLDVVMAQGEVSSSEDERVYLGAAILPDTAAPHITGVATAARTLHARIHDNKSPSVASDWEQVVVEGNGQTIPMQWYGEYLWRAAVTDPGDYRVCATDAAGNHACSAVTSVA